MKVLVDADACPRNVMNFLKENQARLGYGLLTVSTSNHMLDGEYHITVDPEPQAVDIVIANRVQQGDIVVTQDWGLAAVVLGKKASAIAPSGLVYTSDRIPFMLEQRNMLARHRRGGGRTKGPAARTSADDERFQRAFMELLQTSENSSLE
ncbi:MAG: YaiI/YqxD family protein [Bacillota bacterium]